MDLEEDTTIRNRVRRVNILLNSKHVESNVEGVVLASQSVAEFSSDFAVERFVCWVDLLSKISVRCDSLATSYLASLCFKKLIKSISNVPAAAREISTQKVPLIVSSLLQFPSKDPLPQLECIFSTMSNFPASCGALKSRITKHLLPLLSSDIDQVQNDAIKCWSLLPYLGPAGVQQIEHSKNWLSHTEEVLCLLDNLLSRFINKEDSYTDIGIGLKSISFDPLPVKEPEKSLGLKSRLIVLLKCLQELLNSNFSVPVQIPFHKIVKLFIKILNISPYGMGHTSEMIERSSYLPRLHEVALSCFSVFIFVCEDHCSMYSTEIQKVVVNLLDQTNNPKTRSFIYYFINNWVAKCPTMFLAESDAQSQRIFTHFFQDMQSQRTSNNKKPLKNGTPSKKRKKSSFDISIKFSSQVTPDLTISVITALNTIVQKLGQILSSKVHKNCQRATIALLLKCQNHNFSQSYSRLLLYKLLLSLILNSGSAVIPPLAFARHLFENGRSDKSNDIRVFCQHALLVCNSYVYSNLSTVHYCGINLLQNKLEQKAMMDELVNGNTNTNEDNFIASMVEVDPVGNRKNDFETVDAEEIVTVTKIEQVKNGTEEDSCSEAANEEIEYENNSDISEVIEEINEQTGMDFLAEPPTYAHNGASDQTSPSVMFSSVVQDDDEVLEEEKEIQATVEEDGVVLMESNDITNMLNDFVDADADID